MLQVCDNGIVTVLGAGVMRVTLEDSISIYTRASRKWFGARALKKTQERIEQLAKAGDLAGARVHERVKQHILKFEPCLSG